MGGEGKRVALGAEMRPDGSLRGPPSFQGAGTSVSCAFGASVPELFALRGGIQQEACWLGHAGNERRRTWESQSFKYSRACSILPDILSSAAHSSC